jgi:hypothetical protein
MIGLRAPLEAGLLSRHWLTSALLLIRGQRCRNKIGQLGLDGAENVALIDVWRRAA